MTRRPNSRGFVLLIVLVVLVIAGTVLATCARRSCLQAARAGAAQRELQVRWGTTSISAICLPAAERFLAREAAENERDIVTQARRSVTLGGVRFALVLSDEQAKANVNLLADRQGDLGLPATLAELQATQREVLSVSLRPRLYKAAGITSVPMLYAGLGQVFRFEHPRQLIDPASDEPGPTSNITCWGSGKVNFRRADKAVLRRVLAGLLTEGQLAKLEKFRTESPDGTLEELIALLELDRKNKDREKRGNEEMTRDAEAMALELRSLLTDVSQCHSLWIIAEGESRKWYRLSVYQTADAENDSQQWIFKW